MDIFTLVLMRNLELNVGTYFNVLSVKTKYGAVAATATPIVILAGALLAWIYVRRAYKETKINKRWRSVFQRSVALASLHGGRLALERLMDYQQARADPAILDEALSNLKRLLSQEHPNFYKLQKVVGNLEMNGKEEEALETLEKELANAVKKNKAQEAYEIGMVLVEMNIYKGDFEKASKYSCLREEQISDARRPLYKAIISVMRNDTHTASKYWRQFKEMRGQFLGPTASEGDVHKTITRFDAFEKIVKTLKEDIGRAHKDRI